ncbi:DUF5302 domain-containing protein [Raineyella fluvialis]|uniref:DUF5302 domain-containing protein n=1 Tax=Raineyella fluvialis TaxID=2662261 RepID=A0A5Q2FBL0_9ACTN|nr:DUF5302 domain-containing protein [Raineyella fluvialis]QGF23791.1 hypothetical protein Rai3103_09010 [Raineyella fluvialis]
MTTPEAPKGDSSAPLDPKEQMRQALEAKRAGAHAGTPHDPQPNSLGGPHGKAGGKRQFRRKSGS